MTVATLTSLGNAPSRLSSHVRGALNVGRTEGELVAKITQTYAYAGMPAALNDLDVALGGERRGKDAPGLLRRWRLPSRPTGLGSAPVSLATDRRRGTGPECARFRASASLLPPVERSVKP